MATQTVPTGQPLDVQAAFISSDGDYGDWSVTQTVTADPIAPGTPVNMSAPNGTGSVTVSAQASNDNTAFLVFKRGTTGQTFSQATFIRRDPVAPGQVVSFTNTPGAGTYRYWCSAENISGVPSSAQASVTTTVS